MGRKHHLPNDEDELQATVGQISRVNPLFGFLYHARSFCELCELNIDTCRQIAFAKMYATRTAQETAADAVQIFGGRGITKTGMGRFIEHYHRTVTFDAILGGAEDVLGDLGVRQAVKKMPKTARL